MSHRTRQPARIDEGDIDFSTINTQPTRGLTSSNGEGSGASGATTTGNSGDGAVRQVATHLQSLLSSSTEDDGRGGNSGGGVVNRAFDPALRPFTSRNRRRMMGFTAATTAATGQTGANGSTFPSSTFAGDEGDTEANRAAVEEAYRLSKANTLQALLGGSNPLNSIAGTSDTAEREEDVGAVQMRRFKEEYLVSRQNWCATRYHLLSAPEHMEANSLKGTKEMVETPSNTITSTTSTTKNDHNSSPSGDTPTVAAVLVPFSQSHTLLEDLFRDGVPDVEPWDMPLLSFPRYDPVRFLKKEFQQQQQEQPTGGSDRNPPPPADSPLLHVDRLFLPDSFSSLYVLPGHLQRDAAGLTNAPRIIAPTARVYKTKEEEKAERRERMREKHQRMQKERAKQKREQLAEESKGAQEIEGGVIELSSAAGGGKAHDRLSYSNIRLNLFDASVLNPLGMENVVHSQYEQRFFEHQKRNHDRHVDALPGQIEKREKDRVRHAEDRPCLRVFHISPIFSPAHLSKLRRFANDNLLRGCLVWIGKSEAVLFIEGGDVAVRHVQRWVMEKMRWESSETRATLLYGCDLPSHETFSFHAKKAGGGDGIASRKRAREYDDDNNKNNNNIDDNDDHEADDGGKRNEDDMNREPVYMAFVDTFDEAEKFFTLVPRSGPWKDVMHMWRAIIRDAIAGSKAH